MGLVFIPENILGNVETVKSLYLGPESQFSRSAPVSSDGLSIYPETFKADQRHCFRRRPATRLLDERMRSVIEELM